MSNLSAVAQRAKAEATKQSRGPSFRDVSKDQPSDAQLRVCPLGFLGPQPPLSWNLWQEPLSRGVWRGKYRVLTVIKPRKDRSRAFPKRIGVGTYRSHPGALARVAFSGSLRTGSAPQALAKSVSVFQEGAQRFIAGWSSPVARQAHNLKVIGSNPIPATKTKRRRVNDLAALFFLGYTDVFPHHHPIEPMRWQPPTVQSNPNRSRPRFPSCST